ncbi:MAG: lantibiotic ABC transporter [Chloroflexi bacterium HGW-Chloroflexi-10]|nr:MAG: lantibiotic ABC transporter [Chloroflexi bacterium HGW-Chloroflexi-10]
MIIEHFKPYFGQSCEPTTVGNLLQHSGLTLSEPMLFGIGEGLNFIYWDSKQLGFPFLGGRCKQDVLTENIVKNLNLKLETRETASKEKAWGFVKSNIDNGIPVGLKLDFYYLEYIKEKIHFAAHYVTIYGYDEKFGYLVDGDSTVKSSLSSIAEARSYKGPMSSPNRAFTITAMDKLPDIKITITHAINQNAKQYLNPPIQNISFKGIRKTAKLITKWFERPGITPQLIAQAGLLMEEAGTGGALFRNIYRDFLKECDFLYPELGLHEAYLRFAQIAPMWTEVSKLICSAGEYSNEQQLVEASKILMEIASLEENTMKLLSEKTSVFTDH